MSREFDWQILTRPDAMAMVRGQLEFSWTELRGRLEGLADDEFTWEPAPGALSVVPRDAVRGSRRGVGVRDHVLEWPQRSTDAALGEPGSSTRTIAWLVAHLTEVFGERRDWTFGAHRLRRGDIAYSPDRATAVAQLVDHVDAWVDGVAGLDPEQVMTTGLSTATEIDAAAPFGHLVLHVNRELVHHGAEITVLQDLFRAGRAADRERA